MKLAPVERSGNWRPGGSDARVVAVSRLQTVTPETAGSSAAPALSSGRELPVLAVQRGSLAQARPVLQSDKPGSAEEADPELPQASQSVTGRFVLSTSTVDAFPQKSAQTTQGKGIPGAKTATSSDAKQEIKAVDGTSASALVQPAKVTVASIAADQAAEAAWHLSAEKAIHEPPPKEPLSKMLLDLVQSVWAASGSVVDAAASPPGKARSSVTSKQGAEAAAAYTANAVNPSAHAQSSTN